MLTKTLLPLAAVLGFSTAVFAQNVTGASSHNPTGAITDRQQIIEAQQRQHQAKIRRAWLASGHKLEFPGAAPSIIHGSVPVKNFDVANQPAAPTIKVRFKTGASGVHEINVYFYSESTDQFLDTYYYTEDHAPPVTSGTIAIQSGIGPCYYYCGQFNQYSAPGKWDIGYLSICDNASNCTYYNSATLLDPLFPKGREIKLTNGGIFDKAPPLVTAGNLLTSQVSLSSAYPDFGARLTVSDNRSGVYYVYVDVCPPGGTTGYCVDETAYLPAPAKNATVKTYDWLCNSTSSDCSMTATGKWTIDAFGACDVVRNCVNDSDPADIQTMFGTTTFKVVH